MKKTIIIQVMVILFFILLISSNNRVMATTDTRKDITYQTHVQYQGWQNNVKEGELSGTTGKELRLEAIKINNSNKDFSLKYRVHVQYQGWQNWKKQGELAGTTGQNLRLEAIQISLEGSEKYSVEYRVHVQYQGWQDWKQNGELAGTTGQSLRLEAIQIRIIKEGVGVIYQSHVQNIGWQDWKQNGLMSGTEGLGLRMEAIKIKLKNVPKDAEIAYDVYVQNQGWQDWKQDGQVAGTEGKSLRYEAIKIKLLNLDEYSVKYKVHIRYVGWTDWKENGEVIGTPKSGLQIEAIQIKVVKKTDDEETKLYYGIDVSRHQGTIDWKKVKEDNIDFAIIRAGFRGYGESGSMNKDDNFEYNIKNATANNIKVGVYFFSQAKIIEEAREEANYTLNLIKNYKITYPVVIDVEYANREHSGRADDIDAKTRTEIVKTFCDSIKKAGYIPMYYADKWFLSNNLIASELKDYEYWLAHYTGATRINPLDKPSNFTGDYSIWQYTSKGNVYGIFGDVDLDISYKNY